LRAKDARASFEARRKAMLRQTCILSAVVCAGLFLFDAPVFAQVSAQSSMNSQSSMGMTDAQVTQRLQAAGYTNVKNIEREGDHFDADAMKDGRSVHVHVNARTGAITPANQENENEEHEKHEKHADH
jgi:hypothetical protein